MNTLLILEILATVLGLIYLIFIIRENIWCWLFGAVSSALSIVLFYQLQLYAEAILYTYYVIMAGYGYYVWSVKDKENKSIQVTDYQWQSKTMVILLSLIMGLGLGFLLDRYSDADLPFVDSQTTMFSFIATYLEAHKIVFGWIIWIVVNGATIALYGYKGLYFYSGLMIIYLGLSIYGYMAWKRQLAQ